MNKAIPIFLEGSGSEEWHDNGVKNRRWISLEWYKYCCKEEGTCFVLIYSFMFIDTTHLICLFHQKYSEIFDGLGFRVSVIKFIRDNNCHTDQEVELLSRFFHFEIV